MRQATLESADESAAWAARQPQPLVWLHAALTVRIMCGILPSLAMHRRRWTASSFPTTSLSFCGLYFSTLPRKYASSDATRRCLPRHASAAQLAGRPPSSRRRASPTGTPPSAWRGGGQGQEAANNGADSALEALKACNCVRQPRGQKRHTPHPTAPPRRGTYHGAEAISAGCNWRENVVRGLINCPAAGQLKRSRFFWRERPAVASSHSPHTVVEPG